MSHLYQERGHLVSKYYSPVHNQSRCCPKHVRPLHILTRLPGLEHTEITASLCRVEKRTKHISATMIDQCQFYKQITEALTPLALRESVEKGSGRTDDDIRTWVCDFLA